MSLRLPAFLGGVSAGSSLLGGGGGELIPVRVTENG
jgi:hypothetical protein